MDEPMENEHSENGRAENGRGEVATSSTRDEEPSALLTRLRVIEDQPLETRAEALAQVHDELRAHLESGDAARPHA